MSTALVPVTGSNMAVMPVMSIAEAKQRRQAIVEFTRSLMEEGTDFGKIPGAGDKNTLLKPGAEKLASLFGLSPRFEVAEKELDWTGKDHGDEPFFYFQYRCSLYHGDMLAGQGVGSCNSWEKKYRYRKGERVCPKCGKPSIFKSKPPQGGWYCWAKKDGCGATFNDGDPTIDGQRVGQIKNDNPADIVNTVDKMAQKRALVAAVVTTVNASEFFTQDIEDMDFTNIIEGDYEEAPKKQAQSKPQATTTRPMTKNIPDIDPATGEIKTNQKTFHAVGVSLCGTAAAWDRFRPVLVAKILKETYKEGGDFSANRLSQEQINHAVSLMDDAARLATAKPASLVKHLTERLFLDAGFATEYAAMLFSGSNQSIELKEACIAALDHPNSPNDACAAYLEALNNRHLDDNEGLGVGGGSDVRF